MAGRALFVFDTSGPLDPDPAKSVGNRWLFPGGGEKTCATLTGRGVAERGVAAGHLPAAGRHASAQQ